MIACPNKSSQEWINLVNKIGLQDAFREYIAKGDGSIPNADNYTESFKGVNAGLKIVNALSDPKTEQLFTRFFNSNPDKFFSELTQMAGKDQVEILKNWVENNEVTSPIDMITGMLADASFTIGISTEFSAKKGKARTATKDSVYKAISEITDKNDPLYDNSQEVLNNDVTPNEIAFGQNKYGLSLDRFIEAGINNGNSIDEVLTDLRNNFHRQDSEWLAFNREGFGREIEDMPDEQRDDYSHMVVPGGENYEENEIATPGIIPSIKGHAAFASENGIGWFRSDDQVAKTEDFFGTSEEFPEGIFIQGEPKTRRILEVQSDLFQKGRNKNNLIDSEQDLENEIIYNDLNKEQQELLYSKRQQLPKNQFLQLLNKDNNWATFFVKAIVQDSAKKGYEKVLFPSGDTASKVEGHDNLEEFRINKENRIKSLEASNEGHYVVRNTSTRSDKNTFVKTEKEAKELVDEYNTGINQDDPFAVKASYEYVKPQKELIENNNREIEQLKEELKKLDEEGFAAFKPIYSFYENTIKNILVKQFGKEAVTEVKDEHGNTWNEINIIPKMVTDTVYFNRTDSEAPSEQEQKEQIGQAVIQAMADRLAGNLGVKFEMITPEQAKELLKNADIQWNGEKAFFYNGKVYFLNEGFHMENVLHEYSHPLVDALYMQNIELFNKLRADLMSTQEGQAIKDEVAKLYPEYKEDDPRFIKEMLVRALTKEAQSRLQEEPISKGFKGFIEKLLYGFKQLLRKVFGPSVKIEKLSTETTLADLAKMLTSESFNIDTTIFSKEDYAQFTRDRDKELESLRNVENDILSKSISRYYQLINQQIRQVSQGEKYSQARQVLVNEDTQRGLLQEIKRTLENTADLTKNKETILNDLEAREKNAKNFIESIVRFDIMTRNISNHLDDLLKAGGDSVETMNNVFYYDLLIRNWNKFIDETNERLFDNGMDPASELGSRLSEVQSRIDTIQRKIQKAYTPGVIDTLFNSLENLRVGIDDYYSRQIKKIKDSSGADSNSAKKRIADLQDEWDRLKLTKERITNLVFGKEGDTNALSAYLEDFTNSPDPIVGGFAVFVKNAMHEVDAEFQRNDIEFAREMEPLLQKAGYSMTNFVKFGKQITFLDNVVYFDKDENKLVTKQFHTMLNPFKDINTRLREYTYNYEQAINDGNTAEADRILKEQRQHLKDYFHQEYVDEYYQREEIYNSFDKHSDLEDAVYNIMGVDKSKATADQKAEAVAMYDRAAKEAYRRKYTIINAINEQDGLNHEENNTDEVAATKKALWREYSQLASLKNLNGEFKQGAEYLSSLIEKKYRKESNKFFEWIPITGQFESSLEEFEQKLINNKVAAGSDEFNEKRAAWIKDNTVVKFTQEFYDERNKILSDLRELMDRIGQANPGAKSKIDSSLEMEEVLDITTGFRDEDGQVVGTDISDAAKQKVKELQQAIIDKRDAYEQLNGLTKGENAELSQFFDKISRREKLTTAESLRFNDLLDKKNKLGIDKATNTELQALYRKLDILRSKEATDYYVDILNNYLSKMGEPLLDNTTAAKVLTPEYYTELFKKDPEFKKWFEENHVKREVFDYEKGDTVMKYERLFVWNRVRPNNPDHYETIKLNSGEVIQGVPNKSYFFRRVKDEYHTKEVVGKTIDNKGNWLPKTIAEGAKSDSPYINEEYEKLRKADPAAFAALEKLKEFHLKWQEKMPYESRLYLQIPRYGNQSIEFVMKSGEKISEGKKWLQGIKRGVFKGNDDYDKEFQNFKPSDLVPAEALFNEDIRKVPVTGLYNLKPEEVSMNILDGMIKYMHSGLTQRKIIELNPFGQALKSIVEDPKNLPVETSKWGRYFATSFIGRIFPDLNKWGKEQLKKTGKQKSNSTRAKAIKNFYQREFEGVRIADITKDLPWAHRIKAFLGKITSMSLFALNLDSAIKNRQSAMLEVYIETGGGRFLDFKSLALGKGKAWKMMAINSVEIYSTKVRSLDSQIMQIFDAGQEFLKHSTHRQFGRSAVNDAVNLSFLMSPRKFLQFQNTVEIMCGMLYHAKIKQTINGATNEINYMDAWEIRNGQIELKQGIDKEYAPGGAKFNAIKNQIHEVTNRLEGNYSHMGQPEINRYYLGQLSLFMKKFFMSMGLNHFHTQRTSAALGTISTGQYAAVLGLANNILKYGPQYATWMSPTEQAGIRKVAMQAAIIIALNFMLSGLLGYDDKDKDKFAKMKKNSEDLLSKKFNFWGWTQNHAIAITLSTKVENETFVNPTILVPQLKDMFTSMGPLYDRGVKLPASIISHGYGAITGDPADFYKRDVGPYWYQKKGAAKVFNDIGGGLFGFTGSQIDPVKLTQSMDKQEKGLGQH